MKPRGKNAGEIHANPQSRRAWSSPGEQEIMTEKTMAFKELEISVATPNPCPTQPLCAMSGRICHTE